MKVIIYKRGVEQDHYVAPKGKNMNVMYIQLPSKNVTTLLIVTIMTAK